MLLETLVDVAAKVNQMYGRKEAALLCTEVRSGFLFAMVHNLHAYAGVSNKETRKCFLQVFRGSRCT